MELPYQPTIIPFVCKHLRNQLLASWKIVVTVAVDMVCGRIPSGEKSRSRWCADWALGIAASKSSSVFDKPIEIRCTYMRVPQASDSIESLLVGAVPQDIWSFHFVI